MDALIKGLGITVASGMIKNAVTDTVSCIKTQYTWNLVDTTAASHQKNVYGYKYYITDVKSAAKNNNYYEGYVPKDWNHHSHLSLEGFSCQYQVTKNGALVLEGELKMPSVQPGDSAKLCSLRDSKPHKNTDSRLNLSVTSQQGVEVGREQIALSDDLYEAGRKLAADAIWIIAISCVPVLISLWFDTPWICIICVILLVLGTSVLHDYENDIFPDLSGWKNNRDSFDAYRTCICYIIFDIFGL